MTAVECRDAIVIHLRTLDRWVPIAEPSAWMAKELLLSAGQGTTDLRVLLRLGRIERRPTKPPDAGARRAYEYRAIS